ncbi:class I SAM-dependent methyltransferase [Solirubrobacter sp. CPCC 204708]|uniref:Class I SAM-dependent methyltransferase n=1 Tax=Solirubrobacter deserti TaxID=2282478 RepID=A0ABT4RVG5_9ACTN|nr:class I SAM-dependent methyltransferase [Solirubrobacter deserti]MBE2317709.1 class I SAM-dependent methyltransferase [Solirubrobacter deserti]MDA0142572.1 class I SAM-dependent methyltransferase [Solirubrobacter deserti]
MSQAEHRVPDDWFVGFHTGLVARFWRAAGATMADRDAELVAALLDLPAGASIIDVPCADGRIALRLSAAGYAVTGIEIAAAEVEHARAAATAAGLDATFLTGDLRALPALGPADALVSWGNSFGYLPHADTVRSLAGMHRLLRPGGRLLLESMTVAESLLTGEIAPHSETEFGGIVMRRRNRYNAAESRLETDYELSNGSGVVERARAAHHVYTAAEVGRLLAAAGFSAIRLLGEDGERPYTLGSSRLIAVATA